MQDFRRRFGAAFVMLSAFVAAILFVVGHHIFYWSLHGLPISSAAFTQNVNVAAGTAFAFIVRGLAIVAIGTAYTQALWRRFLNETFSVEKIDSMSSLLTSAQELLSLHFTWRQPILLLLAVASWILLPFSTIFPPATLSVHSILVTDYKMRAVRGFDWNVAFLSGDLSDGEGSYSTSIFNTPSNIANVAALQGYLPDLPMPGINTSYILDFNAPALQCMKVPNTILGDWSTHCGHTNNWEVGYLSWMRDSQDGLAPDHTSGANGTLDCELFRAYTNADFFTFPDTPAQLFVAIQKANATRQRVDGLIYTVPQPWTLIRCELRNATYTVKFKSDEAGRQQVIVLEKYLEPLKKVSEYIKSSEYSLAINYLSMMDLMGQITVGTITEADVQFGTLKKMPNIVRTLLIWTKEFIDFYTYTEVFSNVNAYTAPAPKDNPMSSLAAGLEELFQNITFSMLSYDLVTGQAEKQANVSSWAPQNVYEYSWQHLMASYGGGLLVTGLIVAFGCFTLLENGASYQTRFSTFIRTVHWDEIDIISAGGNFDGAAPLPRNVAKAEVHFGPFATPSKPFLEALVRGTVSRGTNPELLKASSITQ